MWAPSCPEHCFSRFGEIDDKVAKNWTVPEGSENSLGETSHWFIYQNISGAYIDMVEWPNNKPCANFKWSSSMCTPKTQVKSEEYTQ